MMRFFRLFCTLALCCGVGLGSVNAWAEGVLTLVYTGDSYGEWKPCPS